jgi:hypothetical protein
MTGSTNYELPPGWPKLDSIEAQWWNKGANAEAVARYEGVTKESKELLSCIETLAQRGDSRDDIIRWQMMVFGSCWSIWRRIAFCVDFLTWPIRSEIRVRRLRRRMKREGRL